MRVVRPSAERVVPNWSQARAAKQSREIASSCVSGVALLVCCMAPGPAVRQRLEATVEATVRVRCFASIYDHRRSPVQVTALRVPPGGCLTWVTCNSNWSWAASARWGGAQCAYTRIVLAGRIRQVPRRRRSGPGAWSGLHSSRPGLRHSPKWWENGLPHGRVVRRSAAARQRGGLRCVPVRSQIGTSRTKNKSSQAGLVGPC
jgi:hypothetical protein